MSQTVANPSVDQSSRAAGAPLLSVEDLHVHFVTSRGVVRAVEGVSWRVYPGEMVALVGESGCGKSVSALAVMRLLAKPAGRIPHGRVLFEGRDLLVLREDEMRAIRGRDISMIFQEPMTSLNPVLTIGLQIMEPLFIHKGMSEADARNRAVELLRMVGISDAPRRLGQYPHQFSGGMRQRVMIAIGLAPAEMRAIRGKEISMIFQEPMTSLNPVFTIGRQVMEIILARKSAVQHQHFGDLVTDRQHRVERGHRLLEDHRYRIAANLAHLRLGKQQQIAPFEHDPPGDRSPRRRRDQAQNRQ